LTAIHSLDLGQVIIVRTQGLTGPGKARNIGIEASKGQWIAFADDDDYWEAGRLDRQLSLMLQEEVSASLGLDGNRTGKMNLWDGIESPIMYLYGKPGFRRSHRFLPMGSVVIKRDICTELRFDHLLSEREDLWFLHEIYMGGFRCKQFDLVACYVRRDIRRSVSRISLAEDILWAHRLFNFNKKICINFLVYVSLRNFVYRRKLLTAVKIMGQIVLVLLKPTKPI
jgi:glycosyltransferase involved in cell wall biosynthesis